MLAASKKTLTFRLTEGHYSSESIVLVENRQQRPSFQNNHQITMDTPQDEAHFSTEDSIIVSMSKDIAKPAVPKTTVTVTVTVTVPAINVTFQTLLSSKIHPSAQAFQTSLPLQSSSFSF